jgi:radical SAM protein with 4Fe4S-binding SPASM domain
VTDQNQDREGAALPEVGAATWAEGLLTRDQEGQAFPLAGSLDLTERCNLRCGHCYVPRDAVSGPPLEFSRFGLLLDRLADAGALVLLLTGGEVFGLSDFRERYLAVRRRGFLVTIFTNATCVDDALADFLAAHPPRRIEVTVYGHTAGTYEAVTGVPGSFVAFRNGVAALVTRRLPVRLKYMVLRETVHERDAAAQWAAEQGLSMRDDAVVAGGLASSLAPLAHRVDAAVAAALSGVVLCEDGAEPGGAAGVVNGGPLFSCGAGVRTFHVDAYGKLHPCLLWRRNPYDLLTGTVDGWLTAMRTLRQRPWPASSKCPTCAARRRCPNCAALSQVETGEAGLNAAYYCAMMGVA